MSMFGWLRGKAAEAKPAASSAPVAEALPMAPPVPPEVAPPPEAVAPEVPAPEVSALQPEAVAEVEASPAELPAADVLPDAAPAEPGAEATAADAEADTTEPDPVPTEPTAADAAPADAAPADAAPADAAPADTTPADATPAAATTPEAPPAGPAAPEFSLLAAVDQAMADPAPWPEDPMPEPPRPNHGMEATLTLSRTGQPPLELPLSAEVLGGIVDSLPDHQAMEELYDLVVEHPSAQVRLAVARKDKLGEEAVRRLSEAREFYVLERLLVSDQFRAQVSQDRLLAILDLHPELARDVAGNYASFLNCAAGALLAYLGGHRDPGVRLALVENYSANAALLRRFAADPDPGVRAAARRRLSEA